MISIFEIVAGNEVPTVASFYVLRKFQSIFSLCLQFDQLHFLLSTNKERGGEKETECVCEGEEEKRDRQNARERERET